MYNELKKILEYIVNKLDEHQLASKYNQLSLLYEQARTEPSDAITTQIEELTAEITNAQNDIEPSNFDTLSIRIFYKLDLNGVLGVKGINEMEKKLSALGIDPHAASTTLQDFANQITELQNKARTALASLGDVFGEPEKTPEGMEKLQIVFDGEVAIENFNDLEVQSGEWEQILKVAGQILPDGQVLARVVSIYKSSPAIIVVIAPFGIITALGTAVMFGLKIKEKMLQIKKLELEIEKLELENPQILENFKTEEETKLKSYIDESTKELLSQFNKQIKGAHINVAENASKVVIKKMYNFVVKGGQVSIVDGEKIEPDSELRTLNRQFKLVKKIEKSLNSPKLLYAGINTDEIRNTKTEIKKVSKSGKRKVGTTKDKKES